MIPLPHEKTVPIDLDGDEAEAALSLDPSFKPRLFGMDTPPFIPFMAPAANGKKTCYFHPEDADRMKELLRRASST